MNRLVPALLCCFLAVSATLSGQTIQTLKAEDAEGLPQSGFIENKGQIVDTEGKLRPDVLYKAVLPHSDVYFRRGGVSYVQNSIEGEQIVQYRTDLDFEGANTGVVVSGEGAESARYNFYTGDNIIQDAKSFNKIVYSNVYDNIDLVFYLKETRPGYRQMKYDFIARPGANPDRIKMTYKGAERVSLQDGRVVAQTSIGSLADETPVSFSGAGNVNVVPTAYRLDGNTISFELGVYDAGKPLVIDPLTRQFSINFGGSLLDRSEAVTRDAAGNIYAAGVTRSSNFPATTGAVSSSFSGQTDAIVFSTDNAGALRWATFIGGTLADQANGVVADGNGNINVVGYTVSANFPVTSGAFQSANGGSGDGFYLQLNSTGQLNWASYFGGDKNDQLADVEVDANNNLVIAARVFSAGLATSGADQPNITNTQREAFILKTDNNGQPIWGTYFGGENIDQANAAALDNSGNIYVTGQTRSSNGIATSGAFQTALGGVSQDGFLVKYDANGVKQWSTYFGGTGSEVGNDVETNSAGGVFIVGMTSSDDLAELNPVDARGGSNDGYIAAFDGAGSLLMSSYLGGAQIDQAMRVATIGSAVYVAGHTNSADFDIVNPATVNNWTLQTAGAGLQDIFLMKIDASGFSREWSILYGGERDDVPRSLDASASGDILIGGYSNSPNFPTLNPLTGQNAPGIGNDDALLIRFNDSDESDPCPDFSFDFSVQNTACDDVSTGVLTVNQPAGAGLEYSLSGAATREFQSSNVFSALPGGSYQVSVRDANNCAAQSQNVTVGSPGDPLNIQTTVTDNTCSGADNEGAISVTQPTGANITYELSLPDGGNQTQSSPVFSNLTPGIYAITATNAQGCASTAGNLVISDPGDAIDVFATGENTNCRGEATGTIEVTAPLNSNTFYALENPVISFPFQQSPVFNNVPAGEYTVRVINVNGCEGQSAPVVVSDPLPLFANAFATSTSCGEASGLIGVSATGGTGSFTYQLAGTEDRPEQTSSVFLNLPSGGYTAIVRDGNGCAVTADVTIIEPNNAIDFNIVVNDASCGFDNGTISANNITGVNGNATVTLEGPANFGPTTNTAFNGLPSGEYVLTVAAPNGCQRIENVSVAAASSGINVSLVFDPIECNGQTTDLTAITSGGSEPYSFQLDNGQAGPINKWENLSAGTYSVLVTDSDNCTQLESVTIEEPEPFQPNARAVQINCAVGRNDGRIILEPEGGAEPYEFSLNGSAFTDDTRYVGLAPGDYLLLARDGNGCNAAPQFFTIAQVVTLNATAGASQRPQCFGGNDGFAEVSVSGAAGPYTYAIMDGNSQPLTRSESTFRFENLTSGTYAVQVTAANGCVANTEVTVPAPDQIRVLNVATTSPTRCNLPDGVAEINATGGSGPLEYSLDGANFQTSNVFDFIPGGFYTVTVREQNNNACSITSTFTLDQADGPEILSVVTVDPICVNNNLTQTGQLIVTAIGSTPTLYYSINNGVEFAQGTGGSFTFENLSPGNYTVAVSDDNGCISYRGNVRLEPAAPVVVQNVTRTNPNCFNNRNSGSLTISVTGGTPPYFYSVDGGRTFSPNNVFENLYPNNTTTGYEVVVRDDNGCTSNGGRYFIFNPTGLSVDQEPAVTPPTCGNSNGEIFFTANGQFSPYNFYLNGNLVGTAVAPSFTYTNVPEGTHTLIIEDAIGCRATATATVSSFDVNFTAVDAACNNTENGQVQIRISGGVGPFALSVEGGYRLSATPALTISSFSGGLTNPVTSLPVDYTTNDRDFTWNPNRTPGPNGFAPGVYYISIVDEGTSANCVVRDTVIIKSSGAINVSSVFGIDKTCNLTNEDPAFPSGSIGITASGAGAIEYAISGATNIDGNTSGLFTGINAGRHYAFVAGDVNNCIQYAGDVLISEPDPIVINDVTATQPTCATLNKEGTITIDATAPFGIEYTITGAAPPPGPVFQPSNVFQEGPRTINSIPGGPEEIFVQKTGQPNCRAVYAGSITINPVTYAQLTGVTATDETCANASDASISYSLVDVPASGNTNVRLLRNGTVVASQTITSASTFPQTFSGASITPGTYIINVRDANGCLDQARDIVINDVQPLNVSVASVNRPVCGTGATDGSVTLNISGGRDANANGRAVIVRRNGAFAFTNVVPNTGNVSFTIPNSADPMPSGVYEIIVRNNGVFTCAETLNVVLNDRTVSGAEFTASISQRQPTTAPTCDDGEIRIRRTSGIGAGSYNYQLLNASYLVDPVTPPLTSADTEEDYPNLTPATYFGRIVYANAAPAFNCTTYAVAGSGALQSVTLSCSRVGLTDFQASASAIKIYPNPSTGVFFISIDAKTATEAKISVEDVAGKTVHAETPALQEGRQEIALDFANLPGGAYILSLEIDGKRSAHKLIKN